MLKFKGRRPTLMYYYRELQSLRDPLHFRPRATEGMKRHEFWIKVMLMKEASKVCKIAFVGDHLPRKCGIATFTSDLLAAVANAHPQTQCFSVSVNDIEGGL